MLSDPELNQKHICFGLYNHKRQLLRVRDLCKPETYLSLQGVGLSALQLFCIPNRTYLDFTFEHSL